MERAFDRLKEAMAAPSGAIPVLYHGTTAEDARQLLERGWFPRSGGGMGGNAGQTRYLYLTNTPENARWFSNEKGEDTVLVVRDVPREALAVDPEDGVGETVEEELAMRNGLPGNVVLTKPLGPEHFAPYEGPYSL